MVVAPAVDGRIRWGICCLRTLHYFFFLFLFLCLRLTLSHSLLSRIPLLTSVDQSLTQPAVMPSPLAGSRTTTAKGGFL